MDKAVATFAEFAAILGCKRSYVTALRKADRLVLDGEGRVMVAESRARIDATRDPGKAGVSARHAAARGEGLAMHPGAAEAPPASAQAESAPDETGDVEIATSGFQHWRERSERAKALAGERDNAIAEGRLLDVAEVERVVADAVTGLRTRLEALPDTLGPQLAAVSDEDRVRSLLAGEIEHALEECARKFGAIAREGA